MRPTNVFAVVIFLLMVLSISTPATAQEPIFPMPTVILLPEEDILPGGLKITAVVVGHCTGRVTIETGVPGVDPLEIPLLKRFESVVFYEKPKNLTQGENLLKADVVRMDPGDCTSPPVIHPVKFLVGGRASFGVNEPRLTSREIRQQDPWLEFDAVFPTRTYGVVVQWFPNNTISRQQFLSLPTSGISTLGRISGGQMTTRLPFVFWMIPEGGQVATVTTVN